MTYFNMWFAITDMRLLMHRSTMLRWSFCGAFGIYLFQ